jgi:hypothetical protein
MSWRPGPFPGGMSLEQWRAVLLSEMKRLDSLLVARPELQMVLSHREQRRSVGRLHEALTPHRQEALL